MCSIKPNREREIVSEYQAVSKKKWLGNRIEPMGHIGVRVSGVDIPP